MKTLKLKAKTEEWKKELAPKIRVDSEKLEGTKEIILPYLEKYWEIIKPKIRTLFSTARAKGYEEGLNLRKEYNDPELLEQIRQSERDKCIKEHSFLAGKILREERANFRKILGGLKKWAEEKEFKIPMNEYDNGFNQAVSEINKKILEAEKGT